MLSWREERKEFGQMVKYFWREKMNNSMSSDLFALAIAIENSTKTRQPYSPAIQLESYLFYLQVLISNSIHYLIVVPCQPRPWIFKGGLYIE